MRNDLTTSAWSGNQIATASAMDLAHPSAHADHRREAEVGDDSADGGVPEDRRRRGIYFRSRATASTFPSFGAGVRPRTRHSKA